MKSEDYYCYYFVVGLLFMKYLRVGAVGKPEKMSLLIDKKYLKTLYGIRFL